MKNFRIYLLGLTLVGIFSCSEEDSKAEAGEDITHNKVLPVTESWINPVEGAAEWYQETSHEEELIKCLKHEKHPAGLECELESPKYNKEELPHEYEENSDPYQEFRDTRRTYFWINSYRRDR